MPSPSLVQVALVWQDRMLAYHLVGARGKVTVGSSPRATLKTPLVSGNRRRFLLLAPGRPRGRFRLRLTPSLRGQVTVLGETRDVADLLLTAPPSRRDPDTREVMLGPGDKARIDFQDSDGLRVEIRFVEPPVLVPRPRLSRTEPFLALTFGLTSLS